MNSETTHSTDPWVAAPKVPLSLPSHPLKRFIKVRIGLLLAAMQPNRLAALHAEKRYASLAAIDQWMIAATAYAALQRGDEKLTSHILQCFWQSQEAAHWMHGNSRYREMFLPHHSRIVEPLVQAARAADCTALIEIGCGRGDVLRHMAEAMPELTTLTGLDLNAKLLDEAARHTADIRVRFEAGNAQAIIRRELLPGTVVMTNGGVYEYWAQAEVLQHFQHIVSVTRTLIALVEPLNSDHDLIHDASSRPYGSEASLSHNYGALLRLCGCEIVYAENIFTGTQRWQLMVARLPLAAS